ncbi:MAG: tetratricopeptide repeat protein [Bdellovibrionaceae bacterium]|nr:tetratricopeptide repeat protein [Pseudobdellovibrionaceae bacterium]
MKQRHGLLLLSITLAFAASGPAWGQKKNSAKKAPPPNAAANRKKTVAELLAQARETSRGGKEKMQLQRASVALPSAQPAFSAPQPKRDLGDVKPPRSSELMRTEVDADRLKYNRILDQQISELYKLSEKFKGSKTRGEMWLRLAELYSEKATILDNIAQDDFDKRLKQFKEGKIKTKPNLDLREAREYNKKAVQLYEWFVRDFPKDEKIGQAYFFLGFNHFELGDVKKGVEYYEKLTTQFPRSPFVKEAYFALGEYYFENEKWTQAYKQYSPLLKEKRHRLYTFALYKSAWCLYRLGKNKEALSYLEYIIKTGRQETGEALAGTRTVNRSRLEAEALRDLVPFYAAVNTADDASAYFRRMVSGDTSPYLEKLAYYYADKGNRDASEQVFRQLIAQNPRHPKAYEFQYQIVQNYFYAKNSPKFREELYRWITEYSPQSEWAQANKNNKELVANSIKLREQTLRNWTLQQHQTAQNSRAPFSQGLANEGYQLYLKEFATADSAPDMHFYYGELLYDMGKHEDAGAQYQWVVEHAPKSKFADKAATNMLLAVEKGIPDEKEMAQRVGESLDPVPLDARTERFVKAGRWYIERFPNSEKVPEIRFRIGRLYYQSNQFDAASAEFKLIVQKYPKTKYAEYSANLLLDIYNLRKDYAGLEKAGTELLAMPAIASSKAGADIRGVLEKASFKKAQDLETEKKYGESAAQFDAFAAQNAGSTLAGTAIFNAAVNYERAGESAKAQTAYQKVLISKDPSVEKFKPRVRRLLAKLAQDSYQIDEAARLYKQAVADDPKDPLAANMMYNAALLYEVQGRNMEALNAYADFMKMNKKYSENLEVVYSMARIHDKAGQSAAATSRYKEYIEGGGGDAAHVMEAYGRLYEIALEKGRASDAEGWRTKILGAARRFTDAGKKFNNAWPAKAKLAECQKTFAELKAIRFPNDPNRIKSTLERKVDVLNRLVKQTGDVIKYNSADELVSALALNGRAYEHLADALRSAPAPQGLNAEELKQYREQVEKTFVEPNVVKAREFYGRTVSRAWELESYPSDYRHALAEMNKVDPKTYYDNGEVGSSSRFIHWMAQ